MPQELFDSEKFVELSNIAEYCTLKRFDKIVKMKLRTPKKLFTLKLLATNAEEIIKKLKCDVIEE
jgi:hypothetical protein